MLEDGYMTVKVDTPCMITCIKELNRPRYMFIDQILSAYEKPLTVMDFEKLKDHPLIDKTTIGLQGSPTNILTSFTPPSREPELCWKATEKQQPINWPVFFRLSI